MSGLHQASGQFAPIALQRRGDGRGVLVVLETARQVSFDIRRVYYVFDVPPGITRGHHAHRALSQYAVAVAGSVTVTMDDGRNTRMIRLDRPDLGLEIPPMIWHVMGDFSADCVLLVLASAEYDESDYIRERAEFERLLA